MLYVVNLLKLLELDDLSFLLHLMCASYEHEIYMCFELNRAIFTEVQSMYFCELFSECIKLVKWGTCCCCFASLNLLYHDAMLILSCNDL